MYSKSLVKVYSVLNWQAKEEEIKRILIACGFYYDAAVRLAKQIMERYNPTDLAKDNILKLVRKIEFLQ